MTRSAILANLFLLLLSWPSLSHSFYVQFTASNSNENSSLIENLVITLSNQSESDSQQQAFPDYFNISFSEFEQTFNIKFDRVAASSNGKQVQAPSNIYVIDEATGQPKRFALQNEEMYEHYLQADGDSFATLIRNKDNSVSPFRVVATVYAKDASNLAFDIVPVATSSASSSRSGEKKPKRSVRESSNSHAVFKREAVRQEERSLIEKNVSLEDDFADTRTRKVMTSAHRSKKLNAKLNHKKQSKKTGSSAQPHPTSLYVELLLVTDVSIFNDHKLFAGTNDTNQIFLNMKIYYAHLINGVNQRYINSFANDPDLRIYVKPTNYLFLTRESDCQWSNPKMVGDPSYLSYEGKDVVITTAAYEAFTSFMISKKFPFSFDHAVGVFNKDLWSAYSFQPIGSRRAVSGYSPVGQICSKSGKYSLIEDLGGFTNLITIAHELGHNLGSEHDGIFGISDSCLAENNNIMNPTNTFPLNNPLNLLKFSRCSIEQFKLALLNSDLSGASKMAQCLTNVPVVSAEEESITKDFLPGQIWTADDQCKMIYGPEASFCQYASKSMCTTLFCRKNSTQSDCQTLPGGAAEGTICGSGKACINGVCSVAKMAPVNDCPFGDDLVSQEIFNLKLPSPQVTCEEVFKIISAANKSISGYCSSNNFRQACCKSCKKYNALPCSDTYYDCPRHVSACATGTANGVALKTICARTCGACSVEPLRCTNSTFMCLNGGVCQNLTDLSSNDLFGFKCQCPSGFTGEYCEQVTPCSPNPCQNGGVCHKLGSLSYVCECSPLCGGHNCSTCTKPSTVATTSTSTESSTTEKTTTTPEPTTTETTTEIVTTTESSSTSSTTESTSSSSSSTTSSSSSSSSRRSRASTLPPSIVTKTTTSNKRIALMQGKEERMRQEPRVESSMDELLSSMFQEEAHPDFDTVEYQKPNGKLPKQEPSIWDNLHQIESLENNNCFDSNPEFCNYISGRPEYCDKRYYLNNNTVIEICRRTCNACDMEDVTKSPSFVIHHQNKEDHSDDTSSSYEEDQQSSMCRDYNTEFCKYVARKKNLCEDTVGESQRIYEICPLTCNSCDRLSLVHPNAKSSWPKSRQPSLPLSPSDQPVPKPASAEQTASISKVRLPPQIQHKIINNNNQKVGVDSSMPAEQTSKQPNVSQSSHQPGFKSSSSLSSSGNKKPVSVEPGMVCKDLNLEFCGFVASNPEYCAENVMVHDQNVLDICPVTCNQCERVIKKYKKQKMPTQPEPISGVKNFQCKDLNLEFCRSIGTSKHLCADNVVVGDKRVVEVCPQTCGACDKLKILYSQSPGQSTSGPSDITSSSVTAQSTSSTQSVSSQTSPSTQTSSSTATSKLTEASSSSPSTYTPASTVVSVAQSSSSAATNLNCVDHNQEFCKSIAQKPEFCNEQVMVDDKRVIDICPLTCKACDKVNLNPPSMTNKKPTENKVVEERRTTPATKQTEDIEYQCSDLNEELCKSIAARKTEYCKENVIVNHQKMLDICPKTCNVCNRVAALALAAMKNNKLTPPAPMPATRLPGYQQLDGIINTNKDTLFQYSHHNQQPPQSPQQPSVPHNPVYSPMNPQQVPNNQKPAVFPFQPQQNYQQAPQNQYNSFQPSQNGAIYPKPEANKPPVYSPPKPANKPNYPQPSILNNGPMFPHLHQKPQQPIYPLPSQNNYGNRPQPPNNAAYPNPQPYMPASSNYNPMYARQQANQNDSPKLQLRPNPFYPQMPGYRIPFPLQRQPAAPTNAPAQPSIPPQSPPKNIDRLPQPPVQQQPAFPNQQKPLYPNQQQQQPMYPNPMPNPQQQPPVRPPQPLPPQNNQQQPIFPFQQQPAMPPKQPALPPHQQQPMFPQQPQQPQQKPQSVYTAPPSKQPTLPQSQFDQFQMKNQPMSRPPYRPHQPQPQQPNPIPPFMQQVANKQTNNKDIPPKSPQVPVVDEIVSPPCSDQNVEFCQTIAKRKLEFCQENVLMNNKKILDVCMLTCNACHRLNMWRREGYLSNGERPVMESAPQVAQPTSSPTPSFIKQKTFCSDLNAQFCSYISTKKEFCTDSAVVNGMKVLDVCPNTCDSCDRLIYKNNLFKDLLLNLNRMKETHRSNKQTPTNHGVNYPTPSADCWDAFPAFCTKIGERPSYCNSQAVINGKLIIELCRMTCKVCVPMSSTKENTNRVPFPTSSSNSNSFMNQQMNHMPPPPPHLNQMPHMNQMPGNNINSPPKNNNANILQHNQATPAMSTSKTTTQQFSPQIASVMSTEKPQRNEIPIGLEADLPLKNFFESGSAKVLNENDNSNNMEISGKALCRDTNDEFCASIAVKIDYCNENFLVNNKTIKELCPVTCNVCNGNMTDNNSFFDNIMSILDSISEEEQLNDGAINVTQSTTLSSSSSASSSSTTSTKETTRGTTRVHELSLKELLEANEDSRDQVECEDFNAEFCRLILTPELCKENYYINDKKAVESCPVTCNVCQPSARLMSGVKNHERKMSVVEQVSNATVASSEETEAAQASQQKIQDKQSSLNLSNICEDLIPTCSFLSTKCDEIKAFAPHPCMRTCNLCPTIKKNNRG